MEEINKTNGSNRSNRLNRVTEYLLYLFVFLLPWQTRWIIFDPKINGGVWEYGRISLYSFDIIFIFLMVIYFIGWLVKKRMSNLPRQQAGVKIQKITLIFLGVVFIILNIIFSANKTLSLYWWLRIVEMGGLLWLMSKVEFSKVKLTLSFVVSMVLSAGLGMAQFLSQSALASKWLGLATHSPAELGASVVETASGRWLRAYGSLPHPNVLAGFIVLALLLLGIERIRQIGEIGEIGERKTRWWNYLFVFVLAIGLFFTFSRGAWLVLTGLILVAIIGRGIGKIGQIREIWKIGAVCFSVFVLLCFLYWPIVATRWQSSERLEVKSNTERIAGYQEAWQIIKKNPWLGVGIGNYTVALQKNNPGQPGWVYQPVHNVPILVLAEIGIIGLIGLISLIIKRGWRRKSFLFYSWLLAIGCLFLFDHFWWTLPSGLLVWWLGLGLAKEEEEQK